VTAPAGYHCPGCGRHAMMILGGGTQAFCGSDDCSILMWDPTKTLEELMADMHEIDLRGWRL